MTGFISRGFRGRRRAESEGVSQRVPPGQHLTSDFPVLSAGPTPHVSLDAWEFSIVGLDGRTLHWDWQEFQRLPHDSITVDIHCVTRWSKLDTRWQGVSVDRLLDAFADGAPLDPQARYVTAFCDGGYTTNLPLADVTGGKAWVVERYDDQPLAGEHGGPARLLVPHLYFWKSAKWVRGLRLMREDQPGFWEELGYHMRGDPWKEQRYW